VTTQTPRTLESLTTELFALISTAQRNGMTSTDAIAAGARPFLTRLLELEPTATNANWDNASDPLGQVEAPTCGLCGKPMPPGEEMFNYHGYSGPCPK
jgi:hypothetical protein